MMWVAITLILAGWYLWRKGKKLEAAHGVQESHNRDQEGEGS